MFRENELTIFSKAAISLLIILASFSAAVNIYRGVVPAPRYMTITLVGLVLFLAAKYSVLTKGVMFSFGTAGMSTGMANVYRAGYWLMMVGIMATFAG